jgi:hypothetical protein
MLEALTHASIPAMAPAVAARIVPTSSCTPSTARSPRPTAKRSRSNSVPLTPTTRKTATPSPVSSSKTGKKAWAIGQRFGEPHWAAFELAKPVKITAGTKLSIRMEQNFGNGLVIGCLRISSITGDVIACLPEVEESAPVAKKRGKGKAAAPKSKDPELAKLERQKTALQKQLTASTPPPPKSCANSRSRACPPSSNAAFTPIPHDPVTPTVPAIFNSKPSRPSQPHHAREMAHQPRQSARRPRHRESLVGRTLRPGHRLTLEDFGIKGAPPSHP